MRHFKTSAGEGRCAVTLEATVAPVGQGIACQTSVSVAAGVPVEGAAPSDLRVIGANADAATDELLRQMGVAADGE